MDPGWWDPHPNPPCPLSIPRHLAPARSPLLTRCVGVRGDPLHDANFFQQTSHSLEPFRDPGSPWISPVLGPPWVPRLAPLLSLPGQRAGEGLQHTRAVPAPSRSPALGITPGKPAALYSQEYYLIAVADNGLLRLLPGFSGRGELV